MFYCMIILKAGIRFRTSISLTFMWWLVIIKSQMFTMFSFLINDCKSKPKVVNHHQIYDLNQSVSPSTSQDLKSRDDGHPVLPCSWQVRLMDLTIHSFLIPIVIITKTTHSKLKAATAGRQTVVDTQVTHL